MDLLKKVRIKIKDFLVIFSEHSRNVREWKIGGYSELLYKYDLNEQSTVFDLGGYMGDWTQKIYSKYESVIYVFEPVNDFYLKIKERFKNEQKIKVFRFGLSNTNRESSIFLDENRSSEFSSKKTKEIINLVNALDFFKENMITKIDLIKINIEGGEYDLLEHLIDVNFVVNIKNIQIQFHRFVPNATKRMASIQKVLAVTHKQTYCIPFVWENWQLK